MRSLHPNQRTLLERTIIAARDASEKAAYSALTALGVHQSTPHAGLSESGRALRNRLRQEARRLNDPLEKNPDAPFQALLAECAYGQWHRMLFARFLAENNLLMHPTGGSVTIADCQELAPNEGEPDGWMVAAKYAAAMLPGIFRNEDPVMQVRFAPEGRQALEKLIQNLPPEVFTADDSLGWVYQFWQTRQKAEVNKSGRKIGGADIPPVTQLFTEHYMVEFLLHNTLGAWWMSRHPGEDLPCPMPYLRLKEDGTPAAGSFPGWPDTAAELRVMDPCCGSGHFLVTAFEMLRVMRMAEEGLSEAKAGDAVLQDNLFGLEIDARCIQIGAFALAMAAWKSGGYRQLPLPNLACSGLAVGNQLEEWTSLAKGDPELEHALRRLFNLFKNAPDLGSLINPPAVLDAPGTGPKLPAFDTDWADVERLLHRALAKETAQEDPVAGVFGIAAEGLARAAGLLSGKYHLVATNVPYLARGKQGEDLRTFVGKHHAEGKADLATAFVERCLNFCAIRGTSALVTPQNWLFLGSYKALREKLLKEKTWNVVVRLGPGAFETIGGEVVNVALLILTNIRPAPHHALVGWDASAPRVPAEKAEILRGGEWQEVSQVGQFRNPNLAIALRVSTGFGLPTLSCYADCLQGLSSTDYSRFGRNFWEFSALQPGWTHQQGTVHDTVDYGGRENVLWLDYIMKHMSELMPSIRGRSGWGRRGVVFGQMMDLPATLYTGEIFADSAPAVVPKQPEHLPAIWSFCKSSHFNSAIRAFNAKLSVNNGYLGMVPFDLPHWQRVADEQYPNGLPEPYSNDPTQWLFEGHPVGSANPLQVAVARLLGYRWPRQTGAEVSGCKPVPEDGLERLSDEDGVVCLPPVAGEAPAEERLRSLLAVAYGSPPVPSPPGPPTLGGESRPPAPNSGGEMGWSPAVGDRLLNEVGSKSLGEWLRDGFFPQHCKLFHNRPFIWQIWDGRKDGFSVLVNYHRLDRAKLEKLIYTYLGDWIKVQQAAKNGNEPGADGRLVAAQDLKRKLEAILEGEPDYDIYVRWKPLHEQPVGWNPDLNDGVRLNIRPFVTAGVLRSKFTVNWNKDRGTNPDGTERLNDKHLTRAEKLAARKEREGVEWKEAGPGAAPAAFEVRTDKD